ncbi:hypothetical protein A2115_02110 [Candidatus Woesebacteria bacterium GWA1_41_8]|uniref:Uncharacterized protein n=1 Tax=Candidatus Woesebacteria bacterium GWA1_41_8 TaxID=1802471 RepID=A0A1F7WHW4_9BACT|nr:MAG: hypothetical protein A2115_02110 [Candidatus Woesebacteria bacterium GWA1_41_8]
MIGVDVENPAMESTSPNQTAYRVFFQVFVMGSCSEQSCPNACSCQAEPAVPCGQQGAGNAVLAKTVSGPLYGHGRMPHNPTKGGIK